MQRPPVSSRRNKLPRRAHICLKRKQLKTDDFHALPESVLGAGGLVPSRQLVPSEHSFLPYGFACRALRCLNPKSIIPDAVWIFLDPITDFPPRSSCRRNTRLAAYEADVPTRIVRPPAFEENGRRGPLDPTVLAETWPSGRKQRFAKPSRGRNPFRGSNLWVFRRVQLGFPFSPAFERRISFAAIST